MRLAFFSDVHGNAEALEAILTEASDMNIDQYICLGDMVGYGADPNVCVERIRSLHDIYCVLGNHDNAAVCSESVYNMTKAATLAIFQTRKMLSGENIYFIQKLPPIMRMHDMIFAHGTPYNPLEWHYTFHRNNVAKSFQCTGEKYIFVGHTHIPRLITRKNMFAIGFETPYADSIYYVGGSKRFLINCGSVGQPRDGDPRASYVIFDSENGTIMFRRVAYDYKNAARKIREAGFPDSLAARLSKGL